jgi:hypothetical protein
MKISVLLIVFLFVSYFIPIHLSARLQHHPANDRVCGTPHLPLDDDATSQLIADTQPLRKPSKLPHQIGQSVEFYSYNFETDEYEQIAATLRAGELNINIWVEDGEWSNNHVTEGVVQSILNGLLYETPQGSINPADGILNIIHNHFGSPPNSDGDGITDFLITDIKDGWQEGEGFIAGYFNPIDQYENDGKKTRSSNERDILYIDSVPGIFRDNAYHYDRVLGTVSHEYQHLIQFNYDKNEETWINEGLSELSTFFCGYGLRNPSSYLSDTRIGLSTWDSDLPEALSHYAKVSLWTYYLYEKFGPDVIKNVAQSGISGKNSITDALSSQGYSFSFQDVMYNFFSAITLNNGQSDPLHAFLFDQLIGLYADPTALVYNFPKDATVIQDAHSLYLYKFENGDTLDVQFLGLNPNIELYLNKFGDQSDVLLQPIENSNYYDEDFGNIWKQLCLMVINTGDKSEVVALNAVAKQKYHVSPIIYFEGDPSYNITSDKNINANKFIAPFDSCRLKYVSFFNYQSSGAIIVHAFLDQLEDGKNPASLKKSFSNALQNEWVMLDVEDLNITRNYGETFDIGIEYTHNGTMGYSKTPSDLEKSFIKKNTSGEFSSLSTFKVKEEDLDGVWMINMTYLAPLWHKPPEEITSPNRYTIEVLGPTPFPVPGNPNLRIQYTLQEAGQVKIQVFNILGQKVSTIFDGFEPGPIGFQTWDGKNQNLQPVASGQYFLRFESGGQSEIRKIIIMR